jgi:Kef-type K+ transport system membrane component KefB
VVVLELVFGVILGPHILGLKVTPFISFFSNLGLGLLFFFAGYEIDLHRIAGTPVRLALLGWAISLAIAYTLGGILAAAGVVLSLLYTGSALVTTAIGTLIPILSDAHELRTRLGTYLLAAGAIGEFGPVLLLTLILSAQSTLHNALILVAFVFVVVAVAVFAVRSSQRTVPLFEKTLESSSQLAVRWIVVLVFALALLAYKLGLDLLLGGFAAGMITRQLLKERELPAFDSKLTAIGFGVFVPFFFIVSGMRLDVASLFASPSGWPSSRCSSCCSSWCGGLPPCSFTAMCSTDATGSRWGCSARPSCRSWSRSPRWPSRTGTCAPRRRRRSSARRPYPRWCTRSRVCAWPAANRSP